MTHRLIPVVAAMVAVLVCTGCSGSPGRPKSNSEIIAPNEIIDFNLLYGQNCAGCHGASGRGGAAIALANPVFLAIADDNVIRRTAATGVPGTPMPAFAQAAGGMLTDNGGDGRGGNKASSIVNGAYLALVSDQELRTIVIAGRPELGAPDWRGNVEGRPMSAEEISDVVAWLSAHRTQSQVSHTRFLPRSGTKGAFDE